MNNRLMPLVLAIVTLGVISGVLLVTVGTSGNDTKAVTFAPEGGGNVGVTCAKDVPNCDVDHVGGSGAQSAMCVESVPDCNDMIVVPGGGGPGQTCTKDNPDCNDMQLGNQSDPAPSSAYMVSVDFTADVQQADMDLVNELIHSFDANADVIVEERFPPSASAVVQSGTEGFCASVVAKLESIHAVGNATCVTYTPPAPSGEPSTPIGSEPGASEGGAGDCAPDMTECYSPPYNPGIR
jgi:hypothetical protein